MRLLSPAKINLFLRVLFRRADGFHELASLFQAVNLFDEISLEPSEKDSFTSNDSSLPLDENNLIIKALHLFRKKTNSDLHFKIYLNKKIPTQAGLGGGSGNAATMLFALNQLHGCLYSEEMLQAWSGEIGSDIPFFFSLGTAYCRGRGEIVENRNIKTEKMFWVVKPSFGLSTPTIFKNLNLAKCSTQNPESLLQNFLINKFSFVNDLENVALEISPELKNLRKELLNQGFESVFLTGSGSALICVGKNIPSVTYPTTCYPLKFVEREVGKWYSIT